MNVTVVNATQYTYSIFAQAGGRSQLRLEQLGSGSFPANTYADFDLTPKTATVGNGADSAPIAVLTNALLVTSGAFIALFLTGTTFNLSSFMGVIMVIGLVAKNGILLLDADAKFRAAGFSALESIIQAGRRRLRPILMTALAAAVGMLPLALGIGSGSQMLQPLAIAVIGGLLIATVLSLMVTPAIYYYLTTLSNHGARAPSTG